MQNRHLIIALLLFLAFGTLSVRAERAWSGSIHLVESNILLHFGGMEYGYWSDVGYLKLPGSSIRGGTYQGLVAYRFLPDPNDPLRSTIKGTVRLEIDGKKAKIKNLVLVRRTPTADWRIDPEIIERLKESETAKHDLELKREEPNTRSIAEEKAKEKEKSHD
ncbi:hypothetical protein [Aporhodopirellula aestuarii]|uniref:Uncharacterized protein n=1 Tax=Aporhodopirellula aestuarii TaxID=2950107 RepID=A0ABT0U8U0_9BACT|nr:hypothetical protein [Aporhodopirellula aestuarii]MCM2372761.1 hypothetical protein [Aporhodopirellula aestuarii]